MGTHLYSACYAWNRSKTACLHAALKSLRHNLMEKAVWGALRELGLLLTNTPRGLPLIKSFDVDIDIVWSKLQIRHTLLFCVHTLPSTLPPPPLPPPPTYPSQITVTLTSFPDQGSVGPIAAICQWSAVTLTQPCVCGEQESGTAKGRITELCTVQP